MLGNMADTVGSGLLQGSVRFRGLLQGSVLSALGAISSVEVLFGTAFFPSTAVPAYPLAMGI